MPNLKRVLPFALIPSATLGGCGLGVPQKDLFVDDNIVPKYPSTQGELEETIVANIKCEIRKGVYLAMSLPNVDKWLGTWGATVSLKIQVEEQSGLNPGVTVIDPLENATKVFRVGGNFATSQFFNLGIGAIHLLESRASR